jgi:sugar phosphate isomerase/epimerase
MKTMRGPGLFLAQFAGDGAPFNSWGAITAWAADCGYRGVQVPSWDARLFDLETAASSRDYCDTFKGQAAENGIEVTELSTHLQGQLVAVHPAYDTAFDGFAAAPSAATQGPAGMGGGSGEEGADRQPEPWPDRACHILGGARMALHLPLAAAPGGAGGGGVRRACPPLAARSWTMPRRCGVDVCYEIHPGEDLHDGVSYRDVPGSRGGHARANMLYDPSHYVLQHLDYLDHIDIYHDRIRMFHVKDAELNPTGRQGVYGGFQSWVNRAGRFRSLGDGQVDFGEHLLETHAIRL